MAKVFIAISGNIGSGKSSLTSFLCQYFSMTALPEPNDDNPYLPLFYKDMKQWAFHSQLWFLSRKIAMHREIHAAPGAIVQDRAVFEDAEIFCRNLYLMRLMKKRDYDLYTYIYEETKPLVRKPDLLLYLSCPMRVIKKRIKMRGRAIEQDMPEAYLRRLQKLYDEWFSRYDLSPVVHIDTSKLDFVNDLIDKSEVLTRVEKLVAAVR